MIFQKYEIGCSHPGCKAKHEEVHRLLMESKPVKFGLPSSWGYIEDGSGGLFLCSKHFLPVFRYSAHCKNHDRWDDVDGVWKLEFVEEKP